jgi:NitT/TauT family transport system permease protein
MAAATPQAYRSSSSRHAVRIVLVIAAWEAVSRATTGLAGGFPAPSRVLVEVWTWRWSLAEKTAQDLTLILAGLVLALLVVVPMVVGLDLLEANSLRPHPRSRWMEALPWPLLALIVPTLIWLGGGQERVLLAALCSFVWIQCALRDSLSSTRPELYDLARSLGASRLRFEWKVRLPEALPGLFRGLRGGVRAAITAVVVAGFVAGDMGLGSLAAEAVFRMNRPLGIATLLAILLLTLGLEALIRCAERLAHVTHRPRRS